MQTLGFEPQPSLIFAPLKRGNTCPASSPRWAGAPRPNIADSEVCSNESQPWPHCSHLRNLKQSPVWGCGLGFRAFFFFFLISKKLSCAAQVMNCCPVSSRHAGLLFLFNWKCKNYSCVTTRGQSNKQNLQDGHLLRVVVVVIAQDDRRKGRVGKKLRGERGAGGG